MNILISTLKVISIFIVVGSLHAGAYALCSYLLGEPSSVSVFFIPLLPFYLISAYLILKLPTLK